MIRIRLPEAEAQTLEAEFRSTPDRKLRDRLQIVLLAHKGRPHGDIAADLSVHRKTVARWLNAYCDGGLDALLPTKAKGKEPRHLGRPRGRDPGVGDRRAGQPGAGPGQLDA